MLCKEQMAVGKGGEALAKGPACRHPDLRLPASRTVRNYVCIVEAPQSVACVTAELS